jgi:hypothetical protein
MKVKLDKKKLLDSLYSEEELEALSKIESLYQIRTLKAIVHYGDDVIEVDKLNEYNQAFIEKFEIYCYCIPVENYILNKKLSIEE